MRDCENKNLRRGKRKNWRGILVAVGLGCLCANYFAFADGPSAYDKTLELSDDRDSIVTFTSVDGVDNKPSLEQAPGPVSGNDLTMLSIDVAGAQGIKFKAGGDFAGRKLTLKHDGTVASGDDANGLISATNTEGNAMVIDLTDASGKTKRPFAIVLDPGTGKDPAGYKFKAKTTLENVDQETSGAASIIGVVDGSVETATINDFIFDPMGAKVTAEASATTTSEDSAVTSGSVVFGGVDGGSFKNWTVGNFGLDSSLDASAIAKSGGAATATSAVYGVAQGGSISNLTVGNSGSKAIITSLSIAKSDDTAIAASTVYGVARGGSVSNLTVGNFGSEAVLAAASFAGQKAEAVPNAEVYASVFGAGFGKKITNLAIGDFGPNSTLVSSAIVPPTLGNGGARSSVFGMGSVDSTAFDDSSSSLTDEIVTVMNRITVGNLGDGVSISSHASAKGGAYASVFGVGNSVLEHSKIANLTAEFRGSATVAATAFSSTSSSAFIGLLGGAKNSDFRFYFNAPVPSTDLEAGTSVVLAALKLTAPWTEEEEDGLVTTAASENQWADSPSLAAALGPNFQLNIGRSRSMESSWQEQAAAHETPKSSNGTWETDDSVTFGGAAYGGPGTMHILGAIEKARNSIDTKNSAMRIDSGWRVNAYGPIKDFQRVEILNGLLHLATTDDAGLGIASSQLQSHINVQIDNNSPEDISYGNDEVALTTTDYPIKGGLTIDEGQILVFGASAGVKDSATATFFGEEKDLSAFSKVNGALEAYSLENNAPLALKSGAKIAIRASTSAGDAKLLRTTPGAVQNFYLVRLNSVVGYANIQNAVSINLASGNSLGVSGSNPISLGTATLWKLIESEEVGVGSILIDPKYDDYFNWVDPQLYWMSDETNSRSGLVASGTLSPVSAQLEQFSGISVAQSATTMVSSVQNIISGRLCDVKGNTDDPFVQIFGYHQHGDETRGVGHRTDGWGALFGLDFTKELKCGGQLKYGAILSFGRSEIRFFGSAIGRSKATDQTLTFGGVFGAYENFNDKGLKTNYNLTIGFGHGTNDLRRTDSGNNSFSAKYDSNSFYIHLEGVRNVCRYRDIQIGPWATLSYTRMWDKAYEESGPATPMSMSSTHRDFLHMTLGISLEKEIHYVENPHRNMKLFARIGWECEPVRSQSFAIGYVGTNPFTPSKKGGSRNALVLIGGVRKKLSEHVEVSGSLLGRFSNKDRLFAASATIGYSF